MLATFAYLPATKTVRTEYRTYSSAQKRSDDMLEKEAKKCKIDSLPCVPKVLHVPIHVPKVHDGNTRTKVTKQQK